MISDSYLVDKERPPSALVQFFHRRVLPVAIDAAGSGEAALECLAQATRRRPAAALALTFGAAFLLAGWLGRTRRPVV